jgi:hypothetical protein
MTMVNLSMTIKCTSSAGHFDSHGGTPVQCDAHHPMQHVQGYSRSHWMPPLGNYSLCVTPAATRATGKQTMMNKNTYFAGRCDGHGNAPVCYRAHCPMEEVQVFTRSHWMLSSGKYSVQ